MKIGLALLTLQYCLACYAQNSESGTLNVAFIKSGDGYLLTDSAITTNGKTTYGEYPKAVAVGKSAACSIEGHTSDLSGFLPNHNALALNLKDYGRKHLVSDLEVSFPKLMQSVQDSLVRSNDYKKAHHQPLLREAEFANPSLKNVYYHKADNTMYVSGLLCIGLSRGKSVMKVAHFSTEVGIWNILARQDTTAIVIEQGTESVSRPLVSGDGSYFGNPQFPVPDWFSFKPSYSRYSDAIMKRKSLDELSITVIEDALAGVYWSVTKVSKGEVGPPIIIWHLSGKDGSLTKSRLDLHGVTWIAK